MADGITNKADLASVLAGVQDGQFALLHQCAENECTATFGGLTEEDRKDLVILKVSDFELIREYGVPIPPLVKLWGPGINYNTAEPRIVLRAFRSEKADYRAVASSVGRLLVDPSLHVRLKGVMFYLDSISILTEENIGADATALRQRVVIALEVMVTRKHPMQNTAQLAALGGTRAIPTMLRAEQNSNANLRLVALESWGNLLERLPEWDVRRCAAVCREILTREMDAALLEKAAATYGKAVRTGKLSREELEMGKTALEFVAVRLQTPFIIRELEYIQGIFSARQSAFGSSNN